MTLDSTPSFIKDALWTAQQEEHSIWINDQEASVTVYLASLDQIHQLDLTADEQPKFHLVALAFNSQGDIVGKAVIDDAAADQEGLPTAYEDQIRYAKEVLQTPVVHDD